MEVLIIGSNLYDMLELFHVYVVGDYLHYGNLSVYSLGCFYREEVDIIMSYRSEYLQIRSL
jgi:hypothetical protein